MRMETQFPLKPGWLLFGVFLVETYPYWIEFTNARRLKPIPRTVGSTAFMRNEHGDSLPAAKNSQVKAGAAD